MTTPSLYLSVLEWAGCALGLLGAFVLATNTSFSRYGWVSFLLANFAVIGFARGIRANGLMVQQIGFMGTSLLGLYRAFGPFPHLTEKRRILWHAAVDRPATFYAYLNLSNGRRRWNSLLLLTLVGLASWAGFADAATSWMWRTTLRLVSSGLLTSTFKSPYVQVSRIWTALCFAVCTALFVQVLRITRHSFEPANDIVAIADAHGECSIHLGRKSKEKTTRMIEAELSVLLREIAAKGVHRVVLHSPLFTHSQWTTKRLPNVLAVAGLAHVQLHECEAPLALHTSWAYAMFIQRQLTRAQRAKRSRTLCWSRGRIVAPRVTLTLHG